VILEVKDKYKKLVFKAVVDIYFGTSGIASSLTIKKEFPVSEY